MAISYRVNKKSIYRYRTANLDKVREIDRVSHNRRRAYMKAAEELRAILLPSCD